MTDPHWRTIPGFVKVGVLGKSYGTSGEIRVRLEPGFEEAAVSSDFLFVNVLGSKVPYLIDNWRMSKDLLVTFAKMDDRDRALTLTGCEIYLPEDEISRDIKRVEADLQYSYLTGYTIIDSANSITVGEINEVREYPQQEMAIIIRQGEELLIPLHADLIISTDEHAKTVLMDLPEGLLEL